MSKYYSKTRWSEETSTVLPPSTYIVLQFNKEVKVIERFVKAVIWSCESALIYIKWRLSTKKHIKLVFHSSSILYFLSFFFPVLKFTLKTPGQAYLYHSEVVQSLQGPQRSSLGISAIHSALPYICYKCLLKSVMKILTYTVAPDDAMYTFCGWYRLTATTATG